MPRVPEYTSSVALRPGERQGIDVTATPDAFGAGTGRGMTAIAKGAMDATEAYGAVQDLDDTLKAKDRLNKLSDWDREAKYGPDGFMVKEGRAAVEARADYERRLAEQKRLGAEGLPTAAARKYDDAANAHVRGSQDQAIKHQAGQRKVWFNQANEDTMKGILNDAISNYGNPEEVTRSLVRGQQELRVQAGMHGWDDVTLKAKEAEFSSGTRKSVTLRIAQDDPLKAAAYMKEHESDLSGQHRYDLRSQLDGEIKIEEAKKWAADILEQARKPRAAPAGSAPPAPAGAAPAAPTEGPFSVGAGASASGSAALGGPAKTEGAPTAAPAPPAAARRSSALIDAMPDREERASAIRESAMRLGISAHDLATVISFESKFSTKVWGGAGGRHMGLIQFGPAERAQYGAHDGQSFREQMGAVERYLAGRGLKPGMGLLDLYSTINAGSPGRHGASDASNGGTPGTVKDKVETQMAGHRANAEALLGPNDGSGAMPRVGGQIAPRVEDIEEGLSKIKDTKVRDLASQRIYAQLATQAKAAEQREKAAKAELWSYADRGLTPDQVPMEVRQAAGMSAVSAHWSYMDTLAKGRDVKDNDVLVHDMRRFAAQSPTEFAGVDLNDYRDRVSKETIKELAGLQNSALKDQAKAKTDGASLTAAFSQATQALEGVGITTKGVKGQVAIQKAEARIAAFNNAMVTEIAEFKRANAERAPNDFERQAIINKLLLPIVVKTPGMLFGTNEDDTKRLFESAFVATNATVELNPKVTDIPTKLRGSIETDLARSLGRKPSEKEVIERYKAFVTSTK